MATGSADIRDRSAVVRELRRTRTARRLGDTEWFDVAYRVYLFALGGLFVVVWLSDIVDGLFEREYAADLVAMRAPALLGLAPALALAIGLRNGAEGGPISIEPADVRHLLLAPVPRRAVLARPVVQRVRAAAFVLALTGAIVGQLVATELPGSRAAWAASGALFGAITGAAYGAVAVLAHVTRLPRWLASIIGAVIVAWQSAAAWGSWFAVDIDAAGDAVAATTPSDVPTTLHAGPMNLAGSIGVWGIRQRGIDVVAIVAALALVAAAVALCAGLRSERLQFRSRLVSQLRFAATVQDLRTVVALRRQLRAERLRTRPWLQRSTPSDRARGAVNTHRASGDGDGGPQRLLQPERPTATVVRRGVRSLRRLPAPRLARIVVLAAGAGATASLAVGSNPLYAAITLICLFTLGLEALEPLSQEIDRPSITDALPIERGWLYSAHLVAPALLLAVAALVGAAAATLVDSSHAVAAFVLAIPMAWAGASGAIVSTVKDATPLPQQAAFTITGRDRSDQSAMVPPEFAGFTTALVVLIPMICSGLAVTPLFALRASDTTGTVVRSAIGLLLVAGAAALWVRWRDRVGTRVRNFFLAGREQYAASGGRLT